MEVEMDILAGYRSDSNPDKMYYIHKGRDGVIYCDCPAWKFSKPHNCRHLVEYSRGRVGLPVRNLSVPVPSLTGADDIIQRIKTGVWK